MTWQAFSKHLIPVDLSFYIRLYIIIPLINIPDGLPMNYSRIQNWEQGIL